MFENWVFEPSRLSKNSRPFIWCMLTLTFPLRRELRKIHEGNHVRHRYLFLDEHIIKR